MYDRCVNSRVAVQVNEESAALKDAISTQLTPLRRLSRALINDDASTSTPISGGNTNGENTPRSATPDIHQNMHSKLSTLPSLSEYTTPGDFTPASTSPRLFDDANM